MLTQLGVSWVKGQTGTLVLQSCIAHTVGDIPCNDSRAICSYCSGYIKTVIILYEVQTVTISQTDTQRMMKWAICQVRLQVQQQHMTKCD